MPGFEGDASLKIEVEQRLLPGVLEIEAGDWRFSELQRLREMLRGWTMQK